MRKLEKRICDLEKSAGTELIIIKVVYDGIPEPCSPGHEEVEAAIAEGKCRDGILVWWDDYGDKKCVN